ncbi:MAG: hypothetical protein JW841_17205 [Deltaproteobacteria bacterium]|nr:hypothetical protein [Deltaproteobacteria bacterium]
MKYCCLCLSIMLSLAACGKDNNETEDNYLTSACKNFPAPTIKAATNIAGPTSEPNSCRLPIKQSSLPISRVQNLGTHTVGDDVAFTIPKNTASFSIVLQAVDASIDYLTFADNNQSIEIPNYVVPLYIYDPSFSVFYNDTLIVSQPVEADAYVMSFAQNTGTITFPNTAATINDWKTNGAPSGTWHLTVSDWAYECAKFGTEIGCVSSGSTTNTYEVTVILGQSTPVANAKSIDIRFYLVTNNYTAASAVKDVGVLRMVSTLEKIYTAAGLCINNVTFVNVVDWAKEKYATGIDESELDPCDDFGQLFTLSESGNALNFFLVDDIHQSSGSTISTTVGIDGSIPGPSSVGGTVNSGAVVNAADIGAGICSNKLDFLDCGADKVAYITAHEGAHWMGLYHTTESTGDMHDPLTDTLYCECSKCAPANQKDNCGVMADEPYILTDKDCISYECGGSNNLMFWLLGEASKAQLTSQQGQVMRLNPVAY